jgi:protein-S-isoprenylcysteine O-methyltransferase Ste14
LAPGYQPSDLLVGLGWLITGAAAALLIWPAILFRRSGQDPNPFKPTPSLVDRGPYRFTRNPMYLAMVLVCVGVGALGWNLWMVLMAPVCALMLQRFAIGPEERYLEEKFGDAYRDYRARVRRWL